MAKTKSCTPPAKVSKAGKTLSKSTSKPAKSNAGKVLAEHKNKNH